jgi:hypothetical protein
LIRTFEIVTPKSETRSGGIVTGIVVGVLVGVLVAVFVAVAVAVGVFVAVFVAVAVAVFVAVPVAVGVAVFVAVAGVTGVLVTCVAPTVGDTGRRVGELVFVGVFTWATVATWLFCASAVCVASKAVC